MKIVILGNGQLGSQLMKDFADQDLVNFSLPAFDLTNPGHDQQIIDAKPDVIINCAAYTNVDKAESEVELAEAVNAVAPGRLAGVAKQLGALFVHISTDFVFEGRPDYAYLETDPTKPVNEYGRSKLHGEQAVQKSGARYLIARTAWLFGQTGPNFILSVINWAKQKDELRIVDDQTGSPTYTRDLAKAIMALIAAEQTGLFHCVNSGVATKYSLAKEVLHLTGNITAVTAAKSSEFPTAAVRPTSTVLSNQKLAKFIVLPSWQAAVADYCQTLKAAGTD